MSTRSALLCALLMGGCSPTFFPDEVLDGDGDGVLWGAGDCDDRDDRVGAPFPEVCDGVDNDCDGATDGADTELADLDGDGADRCSDCDDGDPQRAPGLPERCQGLDDDCDGLVPADEVDADADGVLVCAGDCDDGSPERHPGAIERCDDLDDDCDGILDAEDPDIADLDGDGVRACLDCGDDFAAQYPGAPEICDGRDDDCDGVIPQGELDLDADGHAECAGDCADDDPRLHPGAAEACDGLDGNCDGEVPEADADGDGVRGCAGDCADDVAQVGPGFPELCDGLDDDCDGAVPSVEMDADGDGSRGCAGDCDDESPMIGPGFAELCDGLDGDCDGIVPEGEADVDGDGARPCDGDCDDSNALVGPLAQELCDGVDGDCDLSVPATEADADGDGARVCGGDCDDGDGLVGPLASESCDGVDGDCDSIVPAAESDLDLDGARPCSGDCDDGDASRSPSLPEVCDGGVDEDCDGLADDEDPETPDADGDGTRQCGDCDDGDPARAPSAAESCGDDVDEDCDGLADEVDPAAVSLLAWVEVGGTTWEIPLPVTGLGVPVAAAFSGPRVALRLDLDDAVDRLAQDAVGSSVGIRTCDGGFDIAPGPALVGPVVAATETPSPTLWTQDGLDVWVVPSDPGPAWGAPQWVLTLPLGWEAARWLPEPVDLDGDALPDLALCQASRPAWCGLLPGDGGSGLGPLVPFALSPHAIGSLDAADLDVDGDVDLVVGPGPEGDPGQVRWWAREPPGWAPSADLFDPLPAEADDGGWGGAVRAIDQDGDGQVELLVAIDDADAGAVTAQAWRRSPLGLWQEEAAHSLPAGGIAPTLVAPRRR
jgi:hypothetical protein